MKQMNPGTFTIPVTPCGYCGRVHWTEQALLNVNIGLIDARRVMEGQEYMLARADPSCCNVEVLDHVARAMFDLGNGGV